MRLSSRSSVGIDPPSGPRNGDAFCRAAQFARRGRSMQTRGANVIARRTLDHLATLVEAIVVGALVLNIVTTFANALMRSLAGQDFPWATDLWAVLISVITFLGAAASFRRTPGMAYTALIDQAEGTRRERIEACGLVIFLGTCLVTLAAFPKFFAGQ